MEGARAALGGQGAGLVGPSMLRIAIIGTAGRRDDAARLTSASFPRMVEAAKRAAEKLSGGTPWRAVSGGAAWADHVAVVLFLGGVAAGLDLELPAKLSADGYVDNGLNDSWRNPGMVSNRYHKAFAQTAGLDPFMDLRRARSLAACSVTEGGGFLGRNSAIAMADHCVALTFGCKTLLKPGGTEDTMRKFLARGLGRSVHIDLHDISAFSPARVPEAR